MLSCAKEAADEEETDVGGGVVVCSGWEVGAVEEHGVDDGEGGWEEVAAGVGVEAGQDVGCYYGVDSVSVGVVGLFGGVSRWCSGRWIGG